MSNGSSMGTTTFVPRNRNPFNMDDTDESVFSPTFGGVSSDDARSYSDSKSTALTLGVNSGTGSPAPNMIRDVYGPALAKTGEALESAYAAPHAGGFRQVLGAIVGRKNPALGGLVSGETQRQQKIEPLAHQYELLSSIIQANRQMNAQDILNAKNIAETRKAGFETPRGGGVYDINAGAYAPGAAPTLKPQEAAVQDYMGRVNPDTGKNFTPAEALKQVNQDAQDVKPGTKTKQGLDYDPGTGIPISYTDEGGQKWDVNDPKLPQQGKQLVSNAMTAHKQHVQEQADAQARASKLAGERQQANFTRQDVREHDKAYVQPAEQVEKSYQMMNDAYNDYKAAKAQGKELPTGAQSMLALSTHLSTTFGNVKGSRVTKDMIREHLGARGISDSALVAVQRLTNGDVLSPDQWSAFHDLISDSRKQSWTIAVKEAKRKSIPVDFLPGDLQGLAGEQGGKYARPAAGVVVEQ